MAPRGIVEARGIAACMTVMILSCSSNAPNTTPTQGDQDPIPPGAGIGASCSAATPCRKGLSCNASGVCELSHSTPEGTACTLSGECVTGAYCDPTHHCAASGTAKEGEGCLSDATCTSGLRCVLEGLLLVCRKEGSGDLGSTCTSSAECLSGLACAGGKCIQPPLGTPPFGISTWKGETCKDDTGPTTAYFRVPRGVDDGDFYRLPFPNDIRTKGTHPDLSGHPTPGPELLGFDLVDRYLRTIEQYAEGFGLVPTVFFRFSAGVDWDSLRPEGVVQWIDITPNDPALGNKLGYNWGAFSGRTNYICGNWIGIAQSPGWPLTPGHVYAVMLGSAAKAEDKTTPVARAPDFEALLQDTAPADAALVTAHAKYKPLRDYLAAKKVSKDSILTAAVFTAGQPRTLASKLAEAVQAAPAPSASGWVKCGAGVKSPCPQAEGDRACGAEQPEFEELQALLSVPIFQQGTAPYLKPEEGGSFQWGSDGRPAVVRNEQVCLSLTVPKGSTMPASGWPLVVYAHGTGGSFRSHVLEGLPKTLASVDAGSAGKVAFAVLGIDQVQHGPRRGASTQSPNDLFFNFANPQAARYNPLQGAADQLSIVRFAAALDLSATNSPTGTPLKVDPARIVFWGHSQGATEGALGIPYVDGYKAVVLSGNGASLATSLLTKTSPVNIPKVLPIALQDPDDKGDLAAGGLHPVLTLIQLWMDPADPQSHALLLAAAPPTGIKARHVFQPYGQNDTYSPRETQAAYIVAAGLGQVTADSSVSAPEDLFGLAFGSPTAGNLDLAGVKITALTKQYRVEGTDGHFVAFKNANALRDVSFFLAGSATWTDPPRVGP